MVRPNKSRIKSMANYCAVPFNRIFEKEKKKKNHKIGSSFTYPMHCKVMVPQSWTKRTCWIHATNTYVIINLKLYFPFEGHFSFYSITYLAPVNGPMIIPIAVIAKPNFNGIES